MIVIYLIHFISTRFLDSPHELEIIPDSDTADDAHDKALAAAIAVTTLLALPRRSYSPVDGDG